MKKIKVKFTGGLLNEKDSITIDGQEIPNIQRIEFSAAHDEAPRLDIYTIMPVAEAEFEAMQVVLHKLQVGGVSVKDYMDLSNECNRLETELKKYESSE